MNEFSKYLLAMIEDASEGLINFIKTPPGLLRINPIPKSTYYSALAGLEKQGLIYKKKAGKQNRYFLTDKSKGLLRKPAIKKDRSDGLSTVIIYDIPEEKSKQRTIFRRYLQKNGYTILQKSVLIAPFVVSQDLKELIRELKIRKYVSVIEGKINYNF